MNQLKNKKEFRSAAITAAEESDQQIVEGYAAVFEQTTVLFEYDGIQYREVIDKDAFMGVDLADVPFKYNHSNNFLVLARTRNRTMDLTVDSTGLHVRANLANITAGNDLFELIRRGDIDKMSFAFTVAEDTYDSVTHTRRILKFDRIYDVSAVDMPAYSGTSIDVADGMSARDYFTSQMGGEKLMGEQRKRLILMTY